MNITRRHFIRGIGASVLGGAIVGPYTLFVEPHWMQVVYRSLQVANLPESLIGRTLVQMSDIHIGPRVDDRYLRHSFAVVNGIRPDIVVYTGDFTDYEPGIFSHIRAVFPGLPHGRLGTYGILGNHDYGPEWAYPEIADRITALASSAGVHILRNEAAEVGGLRIIGLDDLWAEQFRIRQALRDFDPFKPSIVLSHNPDTVDLPVWEKYTGWILAGHTHGGQCKAPFLPPPLLPVENRRYTAGEFALSGGRKMYINRGLGHTLQARFNVRPEITVFQLGRAG